MHAIGIGRRLADLERRARPGQCACPDVVTMRWPGDGPEPEGPLTEVCPTCGRPRTLRVIRMRWPEDET
jgi:hypothetical protein